MLKKVLAYSAETATLESLNAWAAKEHLVDLRTTSSPEVLNELLSSDAFNALVLDDSDPEVSFSGIMQRLVLIPGMKVLLIQARERELPENPPDQRSLKVICKPFTGETLIKALHELIGSALPPESDANEPEAPSTTSSNAQEDLDYLKGWIADDLREEPSAPPAEIEPQPLLYTESNLESNEVNSPATPPPESEISPVPVDEGGQVGNGLVAENAPEGFQETVTPSQPPVEPVTSVQHAVGKAREHSASADQSDAPVISDVEFSCVLIPRDAQCYLTRAIAERLGLILPWIHANHGWRLTGLSIRPQHLQWSVALPASISPVSAIREIRRLSSDQLFATFSELQNGEEDQEFWAPGYLVISGTRSAPYSMIKAFMDWSQQSQSSGD